jgi:ribosomal protein L11 methyltransferase
MGPRKIDWREITAKGPARRAGEASLILVGAGSPAILDERGGGEDGPAVIVYKAYLPEGTHEATGLLKQGLNGIGWSFTEGSYTDEDWAEKWKQWIRPVRVGGVFLVKPTWVKARTEHGRRGRRRRVVIEMDPGMAFGTGTHPTTRLCLKALASVFDLKRSGRGLTGRTVLDVGTGTGILAIAAVKLGCAGAVGLDTDPEALKIARKNARLNKVAVKLSRRPVEELGGRYSVVVSNIFATELIRLAPALVKRLGRRNGGGRLILSGILTEEAGEVEGAFEALGMERVKTYTRAGWVCLVFTRTR